MVISTRILWFADMFRVGVSRTIIRRRKVGGTGATYKIRYALQ